MYDILSPNMRHHPSETLESFLLVQQSIFFTTDMFIVSASRFFSKERLLFRDGGSRLAIFFEVDFKASSPYYKSGLCSQVWLLYIYLLWMCTTQTNLGEAKDTKVAIHLSLSYTCYTICNLGTFYKDEGRLAGEPITDSQDWLAIDHLDRMKPPPRAAHCVTYCSNYLQLATD